MTQPYCTKYQKLGVGRAEGSSSVLVRLRCKLWSCEYCASINRVQWRMRMLRTLERLDDVWTFSTFTAHSFAHATGSTLDNLKTGFTKLLKRMRRLMKHKKLIYIAVYEKHKSGAYHIHMLSNFRIYEVGDTYGRRKRLITNNELLNKAHKHALRAHVADCSLGRQYDVQVIDTEYNENIDVDPLTQSALQISSYITKYMTKDIQREIEMDKKRGFRMIVCSRDFKPEDATDVSDMNWNIISEYSIDDYFNVDRTNIVDANRKKKITLGEFNDRGLYDVVRIDVQIIENEDKE